MLLYHERAAWHGSAKWSHQCCGHTGGATGQRHRPGALGFPSRHSPPSSPCSSHSTTTYWLCLFLDFMLVVDWSRFLVSARLIRIVAYRSSSFALIIILECHSVDMPHFLFHSTLEKYLGCFWCVPTTNNIIMNIFIHIFFGLYLYKIGWLYMYKKNDCVIDYA